MHTIKSKDEEMMQNGLIGNHMSRTSNHGLILSRRREVGGEPASPLAFSVISPN